MSCPTCGKPLTEVRYDSGSMLNRDQFDSIRAGDYFCASCPDNGRGKSGLCYWWKHEVEEPR